MSWPHFLLIISKPLFFFLFASTSEKHMDQSLHTSLTRGMLQQPINTGHKEQPPFSLSLSADSPAALPWWCGSCALTRWWSWRTGSWGRTRPACSLGRCWWASWPADPSLPEDSRLEGWGVYCIRSPRARLRKRHKKHEMGNSFVKSNIANSGTNEWDRINHRSVYKERSPNGVLLRSFQTWT